MVVLIVSESRNPAESAMSKSCIQRRQHGPARHVQNRKPEDQPGKINRRHVDNHVLHGMARRRIHCICIDKAVMLLVECAIQRREIVHDPVRPVKIEIRREVDAKQLDESEVQGIGGGVEATKRAPAPAAREVENDSVDGE